MPTKTPWMNLSTPQVTDSGGWIYPPTEPWWMDVSTRKYRPRWMDLSTHRAARIHPQVSTPVDGFIHPQIRGGWTYPPASVDPGGWLYPPQVARSRWMGLTTPPRHSQVAKSCANVKMGRKGRRPDEAAARDDSSQC